MVVIGCDPGTTQSAIASFDGTSILGYAIHPNETLIRILDDWTDTERHVLVLEQVESFGMAVGKETFETVFYTGRFAQAWCPWSWDRLPRRIIKQHLCHTARATDANIRQALIDRFGAIGSKKAPGALYGIKSHGWAALAVAVTWYDLNHDKPEEIRPGVVPDF